MIDGANFDQDEVERFGDPWHGLFRGGVLELPNATTRAMAAAPDRGDSYKIAIPGQPAVTTSTADAAAGMTWLNYGVMTGENRALYGVDLGALRWIYIDADNTPWLAEINVSSGNLTVTLKNFGELGGTPVLYVSSSVTIDYIPGGSVPAATLLKIDDVNSTGRQAALVAEEFKEIGRRKIWRMWQVALSGPAATFTVGLTPVDISTTETFSSTSPGWYLYLKEYDPPGTVTGPFIETGDPFAYTPPGWAWGWALIEPDTVETTHREYAIGATFHNDAFEIVRWVEHTVAAYVYTHDMTALFDPVDGAEPAGIYNWWSVPSTYDANFSGSYYGLRVAGTLYQFPFSGAITDSRAGDFVFSSFWIWSSAPAIAGFTIPTPYAPGDPSTSDEPFDYTVTRETNRVYKLTVDRINTGGSYSTLYPREFIGFAGPVSGYTNPTDYWSPSACGYATAHYDTGALVTSMSGVVCFV